jgi:hypothetical protein
MKDDLDELIETIQVETPHLSAETRNVLHGCLSTHPWCINETVEQRAFKTYFVLIGRGVHAKYMYDLENYSGNLLK